MFLLVRLGRRLLALQEVSKWLGRVRGLLILHNLICNFHNHIFVVTKMTDKAEFIRIRCIEFSLIGSIILQARLVALIYRIWTR